jgi:hypothetical protein
METESDIDEVACWSCHSVMPSDDAHSTDSGDTVCEDCLRICDRCESAGVSDDDWYEVDGYLWCQSCTDYHAVWCSGCSEHTTDGMFYPEDRSGAYCSSCIEHAYYCEGCDEYWFDGCTNCDTGEDDGRTVHDYSYKPDAIFHSTEVGDRLFFGIEMETEAKRGNWDTRREAASYAQRLEPMELAYLKNDGSLNCGFEIVTHPMTHDFLKNEADELWNTLEHLRTSMDMMAWGTGTCGLHIHISRTGFSSGSHMHRFLQLVYKNEGQFSTLAGRDSSRWAKYDDAVISVPAGRDDDGYTIWKRGLSFISKIEQGRSSDRYSAVNTTNRETLELRIFKGTINRNTVKAHVDLAHASVEYTRALTVRQVRDGALDFEHFYDYILENNALYPDLLARLSKVLPNVGLARQEASN